MFNNDLDTLESTVSNKANTNHTHTTSQISGIATLLQCYPVGSIYISYSSTNPSTLFGGTWTQIEGRFLIGVSNTYSVGSTGGSASTSLDFRLGGDYGLEGEAWKGRVLVSYLYYSGTPEFESRSIPTMPPYIAVYMWRRTA